MVDLRTLKCWQPEEMGGTRREELRIMEKVVFSSERWESKRARFSPEWEESGAKSEGAGSGLRS